MNPSFQPLGSTCCPSSCSLQAARNSQCSAGSGTGFLSPVSITTTPHRQAGTDRWDFLQEFWLSISLPATHQFPAAAIMHIVMWHSRLCAHRSSRVQKTQSTSKNSRTRLRRSLAVRASEAPQSSEDESKGPGEYAHAGAGIFIALLSEATSLFWSSLVWQQLTLKRTPTLHTPAGPSSVVANVQTESRSYRARSH